ncbi:TetR/AcrR family transcriptional regulator [Tsukamurella sp. 8F]|uniref:TetR/AcrR family transcriptional regulator n=1 Tax=unclassified Tsukamurella TaxID=2633480 RepID=UPI0023B99647|nr:MULTISPECIES: TetR/AcrR family transcriptional regulator [unclassified Tsukamurella]MDF0531907.1 TetR/AcrR family transcriptional regulator [Tsukamurella sp. 8J]MDF0586953.1 TetR/AcrR family transcriptional regulator [Tsukamurella sp. 8F]
MPNRRLAPGRRRSALLDAGEELFRARAFDDVSMQDIADHAGVTRALLYHYFGSKGEFFGAIWERVHERLLAADTAPAPTIRGWVENLLRSYLEFYMANLPLVVIANRSSVSDDPAVRGPVDRTFAALCASVLDAAGATGRPRAVAEVGFEGWIAFVRESSLATYLDGRLSDEENLALCMDVLDAAVGRHVDLGAPPHV